MHISFLSCYLFLLNVGAGVSKIFDLILNAILICLPEFFIYVFENAMREATMNPEDTEVDSSSSWYDFFMHNLYKLRLETYGFMSF